MCYWKARCLECGWKGSSKYLGEDPPNEIGCAGDVYCPKCSSSDIGDKDDSYYLLDHIVWFWRYISFWAYRKNRRELRSLKKHIDAIKTKQEDL